METSRLRGLRTEYRYTGTPDGYRVAAWLNINRNTPDGREITKLLGDLQKLMSVWPNISLKESPESVYDLDLEIALSSPRVNMPESWNAERKRLIPAIQARLRRIFAPPTFFGFTVEGGKRQMVYHRFPRPGFPRALIIAVPLENLGRLGLLHRVRKCRSCGMWLFARFERERFCSPACREKASRTSPEGRQKRAGYMRRYRANLKRYDEAQKKWSEAQKKAARHPASSLPTKRVM
jgi:hypothetical protein